MRNLKRVLSLVLALMMALSLMAFSSSASAASSTSFTVASELKGYDGVAEENKEAVDVVVALDVIRGDTGDGTAEPDINPNGNLKRAEAAVILARLVLGVEVTDGLPELPTAYSDITADYLYATGAIQTCTRMELIAGNGDGTFEPAGTLTYAAFGKMLLGALGYNSENEGYANVGDIWSSNVAVGLTRAGINLAGVGLEDTLTRQQAMQMVFKALQADMVTYDANSTVAKKVEVKEEDDKASISKDGVVQLAEKYFPKLAMATNKTDDFGRPVNQWTLNGETICQVDDAVSAVATYTNEISSDNALGLSDYNFPSSGVTSMVDGAPGTVVSDKTGLRNLTGAGVTVSVYATNPELPKVITNVVVINNYFGKVTKVTAGNNGTTVTVSKLAGPNTNATTYTSGDFSVGDYVLYTVAGKNIASMTLADSVSGTITAKATDGSYLYLDGKKYNLITKNPDIEIGDAVIYLDNFNNVIYIGEVEGAAPQYLYVEDIALYMGTTSIKAAFTDGSEEIVTVSSNGVSATKGNVYKYEIDGEKYILQSVDGVTSVTGATITRGSTRVTGTPAAFSVSASTVFVYVKNGNPVQAYTGYANVPSFTGATIQYVPHTAGSTVADIVFITNGESSVDSESVFYFYVANPNSNVDQFKDGNSMFYAYPAYVDGVSQTVTVNATVKGIITEAGLYQARTVNDKDYVTAATKYNLSHTNATYASNYSLVIHNVGSYAYTDDTVFVLVDGTKVSTGSVSDIITNAAINDPTTYVNVITTKGEVATLVYIETAAHNETSTKPDDEIRDDQTSTPDENTTITTPGEETDESGDGFKNDADNVGVVVTPPTGEETAATIIVTVPPENILAGEEGSVLDSVKATISVTSADGKTSRTIKKDGTEITNAQAFSYNKEENQWELEVTVEGYQKDDKVTVTVTECKYTTSTADPSEDTVRYTGYSDFLTDTWNGNSVTVTIKWDTLVKTLALPANSSNLTGVDDDGAGNTGKNVIQLMRGTNAPYALWYGVGIEAPKDSSQSYATQYAILSSGQTAADVAAGDWHDTATVGGKSMAYRYYAIAILTNTTGSGDSATTTPLYDQKTGTPAKDVSASSSVNGAEKVGSGSDIVNTVTVAWRFGSSDNSPITTQTYTITRTYSDAAGSAITLSENGS